MSYNLIYLIMGIILLMCIITFVILKRKHRIMVLKESISSQWGKSPDIQYRNGELSDISSYYSNLAENKRRTCFIDDTTWNDLDMDGVFKKINNTQSSVGEEFLYSLLREPAYNIDILKERHRLIEYFNQNPEERLKIQILLNNLGKKRFLGISNYFLCKDNSLSFKSIIYIILASGLLISLLTYILNPTFGFLFMAGMLATNALVYYKAKNRIDAYLNGYGYIVNLINTSKKLAGMSISAIEEYSNKLSESSRKIKSLSINSFYPFFYQTNDYVILEPLKILFLVELIVFERLINIVNRHKNEIHNLFETVGFLDSIISIASYREYLNFYTVPALFTNDSSRQLALSFTDSYHPLIKNPVPNTINIEKPILITGSNASGKSTFLKTIAINAILAQTIYTCLAREYRSCFYRVFSSMALRDDLSCNESYYIVEIKSLKRIIDNLNNGIPVLCVIDEVLRGTNTIERIAASSELLLRLVYNNCICIAATHDIELASILYDQYENYHFQERIVDNKVAFDYTVHPGKSLTRNAIKLLEILGFEDIFVKDAEQRVFHFEQKGKWS